MSNKHIRCKKCKAVVVAKTRDTATNKRLRAMPDQAYAEPSRTPGVVVTLCPGCGEPFDVRGRLIIELTAA